MIAPRPTALKIGYADFDIEYVAEEDWLARGFDDTDGGQINGAGAVISIRDTDGISEIYIREILLHEILHACYYISGLNLVRQPTEEDIVSRVSPVLIDVLRMNPELSRYLQDLG